VNLNARRITNVSNKHTAGRMKDNNIEQRTAKLDYCKYCCLLYVELAWTGNKIDFVIFYGKRNKYYFGHLYRAFMDFNK